MSYLPISEAPSVYIFGADSLLFGFNGCYAAVDAGAEPIRLTKHVKHVDALIVPAPTKNALTNAAWQNQERLAPLVGTIPVVGGGNGQLKQSLAELRDNINRQYVGAVDQAIQTPNYEPKLLYKSPAIGRLELVVLDGGQKPSVAALAKAVSIGDADAVEKVASEHGLIFVLLWYPAKRSDPVKRILFTGSASADRVIAALEKSEKNCPIIAVPKVTSDEAEKGVSLPARVVVRKPAPTRGEVKPPTARSAPAARPAPRPPAPTSRATPATRTTPARPSSTTTRTTTSRVTSAASTSVQKPNGRVGSRPAPPASTKAEPVAQKRTVGAVQGAALSRVTQRPGPGGPQKKSGQPTPTKPSGPSKPADKPAPASQKADGPASIGDIRPPSDDGLLAPVELRIIPPTPEPPHSPSSPKASEERPSSPEVQEIKPVEPSPPAPAPADIEEPIPPPTIITPVVPVPAPAAPEPQPSPAVPEPQPVIAEPSPPVPEPTPLVPEPSPLEPTPSPAPAPVPVHPDPSAPADDTLVTIKEPSPPPKEGFEEPLRPQTPSDNGLLDDVEEPPKLMKISMDTDDLVKALNGVDLNSSAAAPPSNGGLDDSDEAERIRKASYSLMDAGASPVVAALASTLSFGDEVVDVTAKSVNEGIKEAADQLQAMQTRSVVLEQNGDDHREYETTDAALDDILAHVAEDSEKKDQEIANSNNTENEHKDEGWKTISNTNEAQTLLMTITRGAPKARLSRERYFELVTVPHRGNACTLSSAEEAKEFFSAVRSSNYILPSEDISMYVLDGLLEAKKSWSHKMPTTVIPTVGTPNIQSFTTMNAADLLEHDLAIHTALNHTTMTIRSDGQPEDFSAFHLTL